MHDLLTFLVVMVLSIWVSAMVVTGRFVSPLRVLLAALLTPVAFVLFSAILGLLGLLVLGPLGNLLGLLLSVLVTLGVFGAFLGVDFFRAVAIALLSVFIAGLLMLMLEVAPVDVMETIGETVRGTRAPALHATGVRL